MKTKVHNFKIESINFENKKYICLDDLILNLYRIASSGYNHIDPRDLAAALDELKFNEDKTK